MAIRAKNTAEVQSFRLNDRSAEADIAILTALADEAVVSDLSRQTVLQHETRHFYDALLSPFGQAATRLRVAASYNGFVVGMVVKRIGKKANALPVPLQRWLVMPETERAAYLADVGHGRDLRPPSLPVLARDDDLSEFSPGPMEFPYNAEALAAAQQGKRWSSDAPFAVIARGWDEVIETDSIAGVREASTDYQSFAAQAPERYGQVRGLPELLGQISAAHQRMQAAFLDDLDGYVDPYAYLGQQSAYPAPCVGISYLTGPGSGTDWVDATPADSHPAIGFDSALILTAIAELADAIFLPGETSLQESGRYEIRAQLDLEAIRII